MVDLKFKFDKGPLQDLPENFRKEARLVVVSTAFNIEADAKLLCPVDTGALRASIVTDTKRSVDLFATVSVGMSYGIYVEYGTERAAAQPFLGPAGDKNRPLFEEAMRKAFEKAAKDSGWKT